MFTRLGPGFVEKLAAKGFDIFLDLKFHDIPNTVARTSHVVSRLGVKMFNVHALGGTQMMQATHEAVMKECEKYPLQKPLVLGVTILTSFDETSMQEIYGTNQTVAEKVLQLATQAKASGLDGVVASPKEVSMIKKELGEDFIVVTPGVRPKGDSLEDQRRVTTPKEAFDLGSDYIVIGRPITKAEDPVQAASKIIESLR